MATASSHGNQCRTTQACAHPRRLVASANIAGLQVAVSVQVVERQQRLARILHVARGLRATRAAAQARHQLHAAGAARAGTLHLLGAPRRRREVLGL